MESSFLNLVRGNRLTAYLGLEMSAGKAYRFGHDYTYVEIPVGAIWSPAKEEEVSKAVRNQHVQIVPACKINVKGSFKAQIELNPALAKYGALQPSYYLHPGSGEVVPAMYITLHKDLDIEDIQFAVRIYLRG